MRLCLGLLCLLASGCAVPLAARAESDPWRAGIARAVAARGFQGGAQSVLVVDRRTGEELFARNPDRALVPASTQKVLTALAALDAFGPGHVFETELCAPAALDARGAVPALYVRGADPAMTGEQWWRLASDLRALGLTRVEGDLVLDDSLFDRERWQPSWQPVSARAYHAPIGALSANYGAFRVVVAPGSAPGAPARVQVDPPIAYFALSSLVQTGAPGSRLSLQVERSSTDAGRERVVVRGRIPFGAPPDSIWRSVEDPTAYAGAVLRQQLAAAGVEVKGAVRSGPLPSDAVPLLRFEGLPLRTIVDLFLKYSNNFIAESLLKQLGRLDSGQPGSWQNGALALRARLAALGLPLEGVVLVDGSGLSRDNRVSARLLVAALRRAEQSFGVGPDLLAALPIAGEDGTLRKRAEPIRRMLRAKTGTLDGVTALTGFARSDAGREVVFALISNGHARGDVEAIAAVDDFAEALVRSPP